MVLYAAMRPRKAGVFQWVTPRAAEGTETCGREPGGAGQVLGPTKKRRAALGLWGRWDTRGTDRLNDGVEAGRSANHVDAFVFRDGSDFENDVVGLNGQLASAAIDDHCEFDVGGATVIQNGVDGCTGSAPGVQHIIDDHDVATVERAGDGTRTNTWIG